MLYITMPRRLITLSLLFLAVVAVWSYPYFAQAHDDQPQLRSNLKICVANLDGTPASKNAFGKITSAFNRVKLHPHFTEARLNRGEGPALVQGCPSAATIRSELWAGVKLGAPYVVSRPNEISTFVFIVSEEEATQAFGSWKPRLTAHEIMCKEDMCGEVTTAVYVTPAELESFDTLTRSLSWSVGLAPEDEQLPTQLNNSAKE